ncbi:MAG: fused MFS/spermidine synthase [Candidatus Dormiibacterota bacterium]
MPARWFVLPVTFVAGMSSLAIEFGASRLLAPYFGDSLYVWGVLIGLILIYLSIGYWLGGRVADRWPRTDLYFQLVAWAGFWIGLIPLVSYPILLAALRGFADVSAGLVLSTLLAVVLLFAFPTIILGFASPFAIRLLLRDVESGGVTAGRIYALSTGGSIVGTFLPVFVTIPTWGTRATLVGTGILLLVVAGVAQFPRRWYVAILLLVVIVGAILIPHEIKPPVAGRLLYETESAYNYIQVVQVGNQTELILNEGQAIHSIYDPDSVLTGGYWDYLLLGSAFRPAQQTEVRPKRVLILGLAGGTAVRQLDAAYGDGVHIDGVDEDPAIIGAGRRYFHMDEPNLSVQVQDARYWLATQKPSDRYDEIVMDVYRQPYIPFQMTTKEFFELVRQHLAPGGSVIVNAGRTASDYRLVAALASTMRVVYDDVYLSDVPNWTNTLIYGTTAPTSLADVRHNLALAKEPLVQQVGATLLGDGNLRRSPYHGQVFTDDVAPVERIIDSIIFNFATGSG